MRDRERKWWIIGFCGFLLAGPGFALVLLVDLLGCKAEIQKAIDAPDGKHSVVISVARCGATAPDATEISLLPAGWRSWLQKPIILLSIDGEHGLSARWTSKNSVEIVVPMAAKVYTQVQKVSGIEINYR